MKYTIPKGTSDISPTTSWVYLETLLREISQEYGFSEIRTPIFEKTELFTRNVGETSDIVSKEMYTFEDKAGRSMSLRPEGTAPVMRAYAAKPLPSKLFYIGPYFRYDRPQAGRFRQFHQFGLEFIGNPRAEADVETIDFLVEMLTRLGIKNLTVEINSVGTKQCRENFVQALKSYLSPLFENLSEDSKIRFEKNPLRILDSKDPKDQEIIKGAPSILDHLSEESRAHFEQVLSLLDQAEISYTINPLLVRGLDYYNHTVFEVTSSTLGSQNALGGGGRYNGLLASFGGKDEPAVGFAVGLERILTTMQEQGCFIPKKAPPFLFLVPVGEKALSTCFSLLTKLRHAKIPTEISYKTNKIQKGLKEANTSGAPYTLIIGEKELETQEAQLKEMATSETKTLSLDTIMQELQTIWSKQ